MSAEPVPRKPGPKPQPVEFRTAYRVPVYFTAAELKQLRVKAARESVAMSELLRDTFLNLLSDAEDP